MMVNSAKKAKTDDTVDDFEVLRQYILDCPHWKGNEKLENPAIKAALAGLDAEIKRRERDAKLQQRFASSMEESQESSATAASAFDVVDAASELQDKPPPDESMHDWHDLAQDHNNSTELEDDGVEIVDMEGQVSDLGRSLAQAAITKISDFKATAFSPLGALSLAFHACMLSEQLGFECTGIPDEGKAAAGGFAPAIRALPKTQFLPKDWEKNARNDNKRVSLRYRKTGFAATTLNVVLSTNQSNQVSVAYGPSSCKEPPQPLNFPLDEHINLDSWSAAFESHSTPIPPSLHYKKLPALLTSFVNSFDFGLAADDGPAQAFPGKPQFAYPPIDVQTTAAPPPMFSDPLRRAPTNDPRCAPRIDTAFPPGRPNFVGDFSNDLLPGGGISGDPLRVGVGGPGNLMGPNHPVFNGGITGVGESSGFGMKPRFDPFGPPGGPTEVFPPGGPNAPAGRRSGGPGNPNNDLLLPPNSLGNNMFS